MSEIPFFNSVFRGVESDGLRRYGLSILREIGGPNAFKTRLKCICREIALSVTRQTCTWNCPGFFGGACLQGRSGWWTDPPLNLSLNLRFERRFGEILLGVSAVEACIEREESWRKIKGQQE